MLYGQIKLSGIFNELGIGENSSTQVSKLKTPPKDREDMKLDPLLTGAAPLVPIAGPILSTLYGASKDIKNQQYTGLDKMQEIDPGKFSWDRGNFHADRSAMQHLNTQYAKQGLKGLLGGTLAGGLGGLAVDQGNPGEATAMGAVGGAAAAGLGGLMYGGYRGAKNYNEKVIDRL